MCACVRARARVCVQTSWDDASGPARSAAWPPLHGAGPPAEWVPAAGPAAPHPAPWPYPASDEAAGGGARRLAYTDFPAHPAPFAPDYAAHSAHAHAAAAAGGRAAHGLPEWQEADGGAGRGEREGEAGFGDGEAGGGGWAVKAEVESKAVEVAPPPPSALGGSGRTARAAAHGLSPGPSLPTTYPSLWNSRGRPPPPSPPPPLCALASLRMALLSPGQGLGPWR